MAQLLARLVKNRRSLQFAASAWIVQRELWSASELSRIGLDDEARQRLVDASLLKPIDGLRGACPGKAVEFELTQEALALFAFAHAAVKYSTHGVEGPAPHQLTIGLHRHELPEQLRPRYVADLRELVVASVTIIELPTQARTLALFLRNLEDGGWKAKVHCPLKGHPDSLEPQHLYDAASRLSHRQPLIDFHADDGACRWQWKRLPRLLAAQVWTNGAVS